MKRLLFFCALLIIFTLKSSYSEANEDLEELTFNSLLNAIDDFDNDKLADILEEQFFNTDLLSKALIYTARKNNRSNIHATQQIFIELLIAGADSNYQEEETLDSVLIELVKNYYTNPILIDTFREYGRPFLTLKNNRGENAADIANRLHKKNLFDHLVV